MGPLDILLLAVVVGVFILLFMGITLVRQSESIVIERLGRYNRTLESGLNIILPFIDRPRDFVWFTSEEFRGVKVTRPRRVIRIDMRESVYDLLRQSVITKDNVVTEINALLYFQITDPVRAVYEIANLPEAIEKLTQTSLRNIVGEMDLDQTLSSREMVNDRLRAVLDEATDKWGMKVNRVELQEINPPHDIRAALEKQMRAERDRRALVLEAEGRKSASILTAEGQRESDIFRADGEKQAAVLRAEGEAKARILAAEAEANAIERVTAAIERSGADPAAYLISIKYLETFRELLNGTNNKVVFLPYEATAALGSLGAVRELLSEIGSNNGDAQRPARQVRPPQLPPQPPTSVQ